MHVSEIDHARVEKVEDVLKVGDKITFKLLDIDPKTGKMKLSRRAITPKADGTMPTDEENAARAQRGGGTGGAGGLGGKKGGASSLKDGCGGGLGGSGGPGGKGGGGRGGHSIGIAYSGEAPDKTGATITIGKAGDGGAGEGAKGSGAKGDAKDVMAF